MPGVFKRVFCGLSLKIDLKIVVRNFANALKDSSGSIYDDGQVSDGPVAGWAQYCKTFG